MLNPAEQNEVTELCRALIDAPSLSGQEEPAAGVLRAFMEKNGFDEIRVDRYGSIVGCLRGQRPGPALLFDAHIDTVPVGRPEAWQYEPFKGTLANGRIYGRGTSDMKGPLAAMLTGAVSFAKNRDFAGSLYVSGVVHEECFEGVAAREVSAYARPDIVVVGEASDLKIMIGQRGRAEVLLETLGVPAHSAHAHKGVNAVHAMLRFIAEVEKIPEKSHPVLGKGVSVLTDIISTPYPGASVVPSHCRVTYDRRLLVGETPETVIAPYREAMHRAAQGDPAFKGSANFAGGSEKCWTGETISAERFFPGWLFDEKEVFVQRARTALQSLGLEAPIAHYEFCTNASHYAGEAGIRTIGFGPSLGSLAHVDDEYIELEQLYAATAGYAAIAAALLVD